MPKYTMTIIRKAAALSLFVLLLRGVGGASEVSLKADSIRYDPATSLITAEGNVALTRDDGRLYAEKGNGNTDGTDFVLEGSVRGEFPSHNAKISCNYLKLTVDPGTAARRIVASGDAALDRGADSMRAGWVSWEIGRDNYRAEGRVTGVFSTHAVDADLVARNGETFWAKGVRRYEDKRYNMTLSAQNLRGRIRRDQVSELEAFGRLVMDVPEEDGKTIRVTGEKGVFSEARGTVVVSGGATAVQPGRRLQAESLVLHLATRRVEALGQSSLVFETTR